DLLAIDILGAQRLAEPAFIMRDQMRGGGKDMAGRTVVALEADHLGTGKVVLEAQDVVDLRAAPAIDRLVVIADAADVFGCSRRCCLRTRRKRGSRGLTLVIPGRTVRCEPGIQR